MNNDTPDIPDTVVGEIIEDEATREWEWLSPPAAASRVGVSERTLWRMVKAGRYHKRTLRGRAEVRVPTPDNPVKAPAIETGLAVPDTSDARLTLAIVEELKRRDQDAQERLTRQAEEIGTLKAERDHLAAELDRIAARPQRRWWRFREW